MIKGPVALEAAERYPKIASNASIIVWDDRNGINDAKKTKKKNV
jgi:hypothetical protein